MLAVGVTACKKDEPKQAAEDEQAKTDDATDAAGKAGHDAAAGSAAVFGASPLQRGSVLGHFMLARPSGFLDEIRTQLVPQQQRAFLDEGMLRGLVGAQLGERAGLAQHLDLTSAFGCVWADIPRPDGAEPKAEFEHEPPIACVMGYQGGAEALVQDLGAEGKKDDASGHFAAYEVEGDIMFVDEIGDAHVSVSSNPKAFALAKDYLQDNIVARGPKLASDFELVAYVDDIVAKYPEITEALTQDADLDQLDVDDEVLGKFAKLSQQGNAQMAQNLADMEQFSLGLSLEPSGFHTRWASFAKPGSKLAKQYEAYAGGPMDPSLIKQLPKTSWMVAGYSFHVQALLDDPAVLEPSAAMWATLTERPQAEVKAGLHEWMKLYADLYGRDWAVGVVGSPNELGGLVTLGKLANPQARQTWQAKIQALEPAKVLGKDAASYVTWSFTTDAAEIDGTPIDRWVIEPTPMAKKMLKRELKAKYALLAEKTGGFKLVSDAAYLDDLVVFTLAPGGSDAVIRQALAAAKGTDAIAGDPGLETVLSRVEQPSGVFALDAKKTLAWIRGNFPDTDEIPPELGNGLSDFSAWGTYSKTSGIGDFVISQAFIDDVVELVASKAAGAQAPNQQP